MNPFVDIPLFGPVLGFCFIFLLPPLLVGGYALLLFTGISRIPGQSLRLFVPVAIAVILSLVNYPYDNFLRAALTPDQFISLGPASFFVTAFLRLTIMALGSIVAWHLMAVHIRPKYPHLVFFACFVISFLSAFLMGFAALFGPVVTGNITPVLSPQVSDTLFLLFSFCEMVLFGLAVLGFYVFLRDLVQKTAGMQHDYLAYVVVPVIALFLFTPFFIGCCALSLTLLVGGIRSAILRKIVVLAVPAALALTGFWLTQVVGFLRPENAGLVACALLAFAVTIPLFLFEPHFDRIAVNSTWIVACGVFTVVMTDFFMKILPATPLSPGNFVLFALPGIAVVFACVGHGSILRALDEYGRRHAVRGNDP